MAETTALDSRAVLGLLAKAHRMFSGDGVTLSFPLGAPVSFDAEAFAAAMGPAPDAAGHALLAEFSTMMNWVPEGVVWPPAEPRRLDDIVRYVVSQATWATGTRTPEEEARCAAARALVAMDNPLMREYLALKDAWIRSREQLRNTPDDLAAQEAEQRANAALVACPQREAIEQALDDLVALDERAPHRTREELQRRIDVGTGTFDDPSGGRFSPARPLPKEVVQAPAWDTVHLDRAALDELAAQAPPELAERLQTSGEDPVVSVSFEYASAQIHRQWLDDAMFALRCWRFEDDDRLLSDGGVPPTGDCPSYVRAIVLARNVTVTMTAPPASGGEPAPEPSGPLRFLVPVQADLLATEAIVRDHREVRDDRYLVPIQLEALQLEPVQVEPLQVEPVQPDPAVEVATLDVSGMLARRAELTPRISDAIRLESTMEVATEGIGGRVGELLAVEAEASPDFGLEYVPVPTLPAPAPEPEPGLVTRSTPPGSLMLLALICKAVGRSPDPDPDFDWG